MKFCKWLVMAALDAITQTPRRFGLVTYYHTRTCILLLVYRFAKHVFVHEYIFATESLSTVV